MTSTEDEEQCISPWAVEHTPNPVIFPWLQRQQLPRDNVNDENRETLQDFCGVLVDYVSAGHFGVYEQLTKEAEAFDDQRGLELAETIYPRIDVITEKLLAFTDLCDAGKCVAEKFKELGALLHERFELEDCLIEVLHNAHKEEPATQA